LYDQDGLQAYVNKAYENLWGFPASHTVNKFNVLKSKEVEETGLMEYVKKAYAGEMVTVPDYKFDPQGDTEAQGEGRVRWLRTRIYPLKDKNGAVENIVITHEDISEIKHAEDQRRELETQLRQTSKMEAIGTLAGGIAHDFNNILGIILGYAEMAQEDAPRSTTVAYHVDAIIKAGKRGKDLVKNILTFSRKSDQGTVPVRLDLLVKESVKLFRASIPVNIEILHDIKAPFSTIMADPSEVNQVLMNLIANATHAMEEKGGTLRIQVDCIELSSDEVHAAGDIEAGPFIKLTVTDTGEGMDEQTVERIFEPFYTTKKMEKGTGMGLSVVHGIVIKLGGFIKVDSKPGQGTNFDVYFPELIDKAFVQYEEDLQVPRGSEHVLFVDDEQMMVEMGQALLERLGYWVTVNTSPEKALEIFRKDPYGFDLLITDQTMPKMTGMQLAKELLRIRPDMPIVLCTGYSKIISEEDVKAVGIREFAMKPLEMKKMAEIIRRVLDADN
jgi:PAS domain S-box-containing protein